MTDHGAGGGNALTLKASMLPMSVLELATRDPERLRVGLVELVAQSPEFFHNAPVVLAVEKLADPVAVMATAMQLCRDQALVPVAVRGGDAAVKAQAWELGLAWFPPQQDGRPARESRTRPAAPEPPPAAAPRGRIHRGTVRSGQQISAPEGDLVIIGAVNAGAEVLAAGSVHVYGPLRGRALAGIHGAPEVAIFCQELHAELVAIAGSYKRRDDLDAETIGRAVQIVLQGDQLAVALLD